MNACRKTKQNIQSVHYDIAKLLKTPAQCGACIFTLTSLLFAYTNKLNIVGPLCVRFITFCVAAYVCVTILLLDMDITTLLCLSKE